MSLTNVTALDAHNIEILLVDPTGARTYRAMAAVGGNSSLGAATITLEDAAPAQLPQSSAIADGQNYKPANCTDNLFKRPDPSPALPYVDPGCSSVVDTFASVFGGVNPNGAWSIYCFDHERSTNSFVQDSSLETTF